MEGWGGLPPFIISLSIYLISLFHFIKYLKIYIYLISFHQTSIKMDLDNAVVLCLIRDCSCRI